MLIDQKIASGQCQSMLCNSTGIFKTVLCVQMAHNRAAMMFEISGSNQDCFANFEANLQMSGVLELVANIAPQVRHMPPHPQGRQRTQHAAGVELPAMIGVIQISMWGEIIMGNHYPLLLSGLCATLVIAPLYDVGGKEAKGHNFRRVNKTKKVNF